MAIYGCVEYAICSVATEGFPTEYYTNQRKRWSTDIEKASKWLLKEEAEKEMKSYMCLRGDPDLRIIEVW